MLSLEALRKIDPEIANLSNEELEAIRLSFYELGQLVFEDWLAQKFGSKYPLGSFPDVQGKSKV